MIMRLASNRPADRFYRGGARISEFRGEPPAGSHEPEDWIASTTAVFGETATGLTTLPDGRLLREAVEADPIGWLGEAHAAAWGADTRLLVKLLDAGQRLPVHAHPDDAFAADHLGRAHGKAEAWYILEGGTVHIGLRRDVTHEELLALVGSQDVDALLDLMHTRTVGPGDVVWVPPGELHAIGERVLLLELQQPEDLSILLEWRGFAIDGATAGHLGLGFDRALEAVRTRGRSAGEVDRLIRPAPAQGSVFPVAADRYFRLQRVPVDGAALLDEGFAVVVVPAGDVRAGVVDLPKGSTAVLRAADGPVTLTGQGEALVARPPEP